MKKVPSIFGFFLVQTLFLNSYVFAQEQFDTKYNVTYEIGTDGEAAIKQNISIINKENDVVATNYTLTIDRTSVYDVTAKDGEGDLDVEVKEEGGVTKLSVEFNEQVIGTGRSLDWELKYKTRSLDNKVGEIWNINIPKVEVLDSTQEYNVKLIVPKTFGPKIYVSPQPVSQGENENSYTLNFDKTSLGQTGITASFGSFQVLNFQLKYKLENKGILATYQDVAIPPTVKNSQQVKINEIEPPPENLFTDGDGNLMATFKVPAKSTLDIRVTGSARVLSTQIDPKFGGRVKDIPKELTRKYTKQDKYWETANGQIRSQAKALFDSSLTTSQNAQAIYDLVTQKLQYNFNVSENEPVERHGALQALTEPGPWACMEFTDLFIALARANGIPARELNGYAIVKDPGLTPLSLSFESGDVLHAWAEFYDPNFGWVQVDPTWGNTSGIDYFTKLDTNHLIFVTKGLDSEYPYPAGAYKLDGTEKQVEVDIAQNPEEISFDEPLIPDYPKNRSKTLGIILSVFGATLLCSLIYSLVIRKDHRHK